MASRCAVATFCLILLLGVCADWAHATATVEGNVLISTDGGTTFTADNPFTTTVNEGIPTAGNSINENQGAFQTNFEGRTDTKGTATTLDDENVNFDIYVGQTSFGLLTINGGTELRDMNLIIGDSGLIVGNPILRRGTGVVRIENPGSLFNNDPAILPYLGPLIPPGTSPSINPRSDEAGATTGFDLYVARSGNGQLAISLGGRAEIQDAAIVGDLSGSVGLLTIDGISSFLQSGGFEMTSSDPDEVHYMVVGRLGSGAMSITNGGQSYNAGPTTSGNSEQWGAVIGSNLAAETANAPGNGGTGTVTVDGPGSRWMVGGNLQVGGFHNNRSGIGPLAQEDLEGEEAVYSSGVGRGTLKVSNGGLVSIIPPPVDENANNAPDQLDFLVGRFGRVELDNGRIELLGVFDPNNPQNPTAQLARGRLVNDGVVMGDGTISVLQFRNRVLGEVRVGAGQSLVIESTGGYGQADNIPLPTEPEEYPLSNYGLVQVQGTPEMLAELEIQRNVVTLPTATDFTRPFLNLPIPVPPGAPNGRTGGEIVAQNSVMRFDSNIINRHKVTFTGGTNLVTGNFINEGTVVIGGIDTTVTFVDQFFNPTGTLQLAPTVGLVTFVDDVDFDALVGTGSLNMSFGNHIASNEDIILGGTLNATLFSAPGFPGSVAQAGTQFELISSATDLIGDFDAVNLPDCTGGICFFGFADPVLDAYFVRSFDLNSPLVVGGDFDGSGLVDDFDFQIWRQNLGNTGAPGSLPGDANGDGIVDGDDFIIWQDQFGMPGMAVPGAGAGGVAGGSGAVPEPTSIALFGVGTMLALALAPRRSSGSRVRTA